MIGLERDAGSNPGCRSSGKNAGLYGSLSGGAKSYGLAGRPYCASTNVLIDLAGNAPWSAVSIRISSRTWKSGWITQMTKTKPHK